jgi:hypothetical protein
MIALFYHDFPKSDRAKINCAAGRSGSYEQLAASFYRKFM